MITVIAGSRTITKQEIVDLCMEHATEVIGLEVTEVVSGTAKGPDTLGAIWAKANGIPVKLMPADWDKHGKKAGFIRNGEMAEYSECSVVIWDGESNGSKNMIRETLDRYQEAIVYTPKIHVDVTITLEDGVRRATLTCRGDGIIRDVPPKMTWARNRHVNDVVTLLNEDYTLSWKRRFDPGYVMPENLEELLG